VPGSLRDHGRSQLPNALIALPIVRIASEREADLGDGLEFAADREPRRLGRCVVIGRSALAGPGVLVGHGATFTAAQVESRSSSPAALELASIRNPRSAAGAPVTTSV
jgi:hypothetical protein